MGDQQAANQRVLPGNVLVQVTSSGLLKELCGGGGDCGRSAHDDGLCSIRRRQLADTESKVKWRAAGAKLAPKQWRHARWTGRRTGTAAGRRQVGRLGPLDGPFD